jgi:carbamoyl-phosphate synthase large subunit
LEINPRFGGGYPLTRLAGACFEDWIVGEYLFNEDIHFCDTWQRQLMMLRYDSEILVPNYVAD